MLQASVANDESGLGFLLISLFIPKVTTGINSRNATCYASTDGFPFSISEATLLNSGKRFASKLVSITSTSYLRSDFETIFVGEIADAGFHYFHFLSQKRQSPLEPFPGKGCKRHLRRSVKLWGIEGIPERSDEAQKLTQSGIDGLNGEIRVSAIPGARRTVENPTPYREKPPLEADYPPKTTLER